MYEHPVLQGEQTSQADQNAHTLVLFYESSTLAFLYYSLVY